jgi:hypothetical protein
MPGGHVLALMLPVALTKHHPLSPWVLQVSLLVAVQTS